MSEQQQEEADALALAAALGQPVEVLSLTSETAIVFARPQGGFEATVSALPVRVSRDDDWVPVDTSLVASPVSGMLVPGATVVPVEFSPGGTGPLSRVQTDSGDWLEQESPFGSLPTPVVADNVAVYQEVLPGVDLHLMATVQGMVQVLEIKSPQAAQQPGLDEVTFPLNAGDLTVEDEGALAGATISDESGQEVLLSGAAFWWDSTAQDSSAAGPGGTGGGRTVSSEMSQTELTVDVDAAALTPGLTYPIFVDPAVTGSRLWWTEVDSAYPNQNYYNATTWARVGYVNAAWSDDARNHTTRSFFQMDMSAVAGKVVTDARFNVYNTYSSSCDARSLSLYVSASAPTTSTTWNNQPGNLTGAVDTKTFAHGYNSSCPAALEAFNALGAVQVGQAAAAASITFKLQADNETDNRTWKKFDNSPTLTMVYNSAPLQAVSQSVGNTLGGAPVTVSNTRSPWFSGGANDPEYDAMTLDFEVWTAGTGGVRVAAGTSSTISSGTEAYMQLTVPDDGAYSYRVRAKDLPGVYGPWSGYFEFAVDTVPPAAPMVSVAYTAGPFSSNSAALIGESKLTATISGTVADRTAGFIYGLAPDGVVVAPISGLGCGQTATYYTKVCTTGIGESISVDFTGIATRTTLTVWAFDFANNISNPQQPWGAKTEHRFLSANSARLTLGHQWRTNTLPVNPITGGPVDAAGNPTNCAATSVPDNTLPSVASRPLQLTGGACWARSTSTVGYFTQPVVLRFDGVDDGANAAADPALKTSDSFTAATWVRPTGGSGWRTFMAQYTQTGAATPGVRSAFYLQIDPNNFWRFCVTEQTGGGVYCVTTPTLAVTNQWAFVTGMYDKINKQLRINVRTGVTSSSASVAAPFLAPAAVTAAGNITVGYAWEGGNFFTGDVFQPQLMPGVTGLNQITALAAGDNLTNGEFLGGSTADYRWSVPGQLLGNWELLRQGPGGVTVKGWSIDTDTSAPTEIHLYITDATGAPNPPVAGANLGVANNPRPDVAAIYPGYGANHGFDATMPYAGVNGPKSVCLYSIDVDNGALNRNLGCRALTFNNEPAGNLEALTRSGSTLQVSGWAIDFNTDAPVPVHVYIDGNYTAALPPAGNSRPDIAAAFPGYGPNHGFSAAVGAAMTGGNHQVCAYSINTAGPGGNPLIGCLYYTV